MTQRVLVVTFPGASWRPLYFPLKLNVARRTPVLFEGGGGRRGGEGGADASRGRAGGGGHVGVFGGGAARRFRAVGRASKEPRLPRLPAPACPAPGCRSAPARPPPIAAQEPPPPRLMWLARG